MPESTAEPDCLTHLKSCPDQQRRPLTARRPSAARLCRTLTACLLVVCAAPASAQTSSIIAPAAGAANVATSVMINWTSVPGAQAYYLYVGTAPGLKDVVNTGETSATSFSAVNLPDGRILYARIWNKDAGVWRYADSTFSTVASRARLTSPASGATDVSVAAGLAWTSVPGAQAYSVYVGTNVGLKDVLDTGQVAGTSYAVRLSRTGMLYARMWTKVGDVWRYMDSSFTTATIRATLTAPTNGAGTVDLAETFRWTTVPMAQAYYLYVGTTSGAKDVVDSRETQQTAFATAGLPAGQALYARIWTKTAGVWNFADSTFSTESLIARLTQPLDGADGVPVTATFTWNPVDAAQAYYLYVGTGAGLHDVVDTGEIQTLQQAANLPEYKVLHARLYTKVANVWRFSDSVLTTAGRFIYPTDKAIGVDLTQPIQWAPVPGADVYRLYVSGTADGEPLVDSGETTATSFSAEGLPDDRPLFARLMFRVAGTWRFGDMIFTGETAPEPSIVISPVDGGTNVAAGVPFEWSGVPVADGYWLQIGTSAGASDVHDSGVITVTRRLAEGLPAGVPLYGRIRTRLGGNWFDRAFTFSVSDPSISTVQRTAFADWATGEVRRMAAANVPAIGSPLARQISVLNYTQAFCTDYAAALISLFPDLNVGLAIRRLDVAFPSLLDAHTLTEVLDPDTGRWGIMDPTFGLTARRSADHAMATAEDLQAAAATMNWGAVSYSWHTTAGSAYAKAYYIDHLLLFLRVFRTGVPTSPSTSAPEASYLEPVALPLVTTPGIYVLQCEAGRSTANIVSNGIVVPIACSADDRLSAAFYASSVKTDPSASGALLYRYRRFVF